MKLRTTLSLSMTLPALLAACAEETAGPTAAGDTELRSSDAAPKDDLRVVESDTGSGGTGGSGGAAPGGAGGSGGEPTPGGEPAPGGSGGASGGADALPPAPTDASVAPPADAAVPPPEDAAPPVPDAARPPDMPPDDPGNDGPLGASRFEETLDAPGGGFGQRRVSVLVFVPEQAEGAPFPLVVLNHAFQTSGTAYEDYARRLASHGFVTLLPTWDGGLALRNHVELAEDHAWLLDWALEANDQAGSRLFSLVDPERIGSAGHSRGGKQAIFAGILDPRVDAVLGLDPVDSGPPFGGGPDAYPSLTPERMAELDKPTAFLGAGRGGEGAIACAPVEDNYDAYFEAAVSPSAAYLLPLAGHLDFLADCGFACFGCPSGEDREFAHAFGLRTTVAFFARHLNADARYDRFLAPPGLPEGIEYRSK